MQKYKLVYEEENGYCEIPIRRHDDFSEELEICFIDFFTTFFKNEKECIKELFDNSCIPSMNGKLVIKRPNGNVKSLDIMYDNPEFRKVSYILMRTLKFNDTNYLKQTSELNSCIGPMICYFIENPNALNHLQKTFNYKKTNIDFINHLNKFIELSQKNFYTPVESGIRNNEKVYIYSKLANYNLLRELTIWVDKYKNGEIKIPINNNWKNPYENYEEKLEENHNYKL